MRVSIYIPGKSYICNFSMLFIIINVYILKIYYLIYCIVMYVYINICMLYVHKFILKFIVLPGLRP